jgi:hypothetical protein
MHNGNYDDTVFARNLKTQPTKNKVIIVSIVKTLSRDKDK